MPPTDKKLEKLQKLLEIANEDYTTPEDLIKMSEAILSVVTSEKKRIDTEMSKHKGAVDSELKKSLTLLSEKEAGLQSLINKLHKEALNTTSEASKRLSDEIKRVERKIPSKTDLSGLEADIKALSDGLNSLPTEITMNNEAIRDGLELLQGDERLDKSAIKGLDELVEELKKGQMTNHVAGVRFLSYLADVNIAGITDGQTLVWDTTTGKFIPGTGGGGGGGVTDHGALTGLVDDDHTQYHTDARGDARYYTQAQVDTALSGKANTSHTHAISDVTGLQTALDGKVTGPASATDNAIARFDATTGKLVQNSTVTIEDTGELNVGNTIRFLSQSIDVPVATPVAVPLNQTHGTTLNTLWQYRLRAVTFGTSADTGTSAVVYYNEPTSTWIVREVAVTTTFSQAPRFQINGSTVEIFHTSTLQTYTMRVYVESIYVGEPDATIHTLGAESMWKRINNNLSYTDGTVEVLDDAYNATNWNGNTTVPTKNAVRDEMETKVTGPASATDNAIARFDATTGKLIQNSVKTLSDSGAVETLVPTIADATFDISAASGANVNSTYSINFSNLTTADGVFRLFRTTNTTGGVSFQVLQGNGANNINHMLSGKGDSFLASLAGKLGIGVTTPSAKLHVANDPDGTTPTVIVDTNTNAQPFIVSRTGGLTERFDIGVTDNEAIFNHVQDETDTTAHNTVFDTTTSATGKHAFVLKLNGAIKFFFDLLNTRLGIGTSNPTEALDVVGNGKFSGDVTVADEAYDATTWNGNNEVPTKNAVRDKIDAMDTAIALNTAKVTNATHTGEVTGSGALTVDKTAITNKTLVTAAVGDHILVADASDSDNLKKVTVQTIVDLAGGGGGGSTTVNVAQTGHGLSAGNLIRSSGVAGQYAVADKDAGNTADAVGYVTAVADANNFTYQPLGFYVTNNVPTGTAGDALFVGDNGALTTTEPTTIGSISKPVGVLITSGSAMVIFNMRGVEVTDDTAGSYVTGPASSTDNYIPRFDGTTGKALQTSNVGITDNGALMLPNVASPIAANADEVNVFGRKIAGRMLPAYMSPSGLDSALQPLLARNKVGYWNPPGNATTVPGVFGFTAPTVTGFTATARNVATTNLFTRMRRLGYVTAATAGTVGQWRVSVAQYTVGNSSTGLGGFTYVVRFGISDAASVSGARMFMGMRSSATPTNVEPSTLTNCIGIGHGASDTNFKLFYGGSAAQTPIDLGANFPSNTLSTDVYELALFSSPNSGDVTYEVTRLNTGDVATGTITNSGSTVLPTNTTLIGPWGYRTNNATALAVGMDVMSAYIETDY